MGKPEMKKDLHGSTRNGGISTRNGGFSWIIPTFSMFTGGYNWGFHQILQS